MPTHESNSESDRKSFFQVLAGSCGTAQDRKNQYQFTAWCFAWAVLFTAANWLLKSDYSVSTSVTLLVTIVPTIVGCGAVLAYRKFIRMADELMQKIQLEGLAAGFGIGVVFALSYQIFERAGAPHLEIDDLALVLIGGWMLGQMVATWRYR